MAESYYIAILDIASEDYMDSVHQCTMQADKWLTWKLYTKAMFPFNGLLKSQCILHMLQTHTWACKQTCTHTRTHTRTHARTGSMSICIT